MSLSDSGPKLSRSVSRASISSTGSSAATSTGGAGRGNYNSSALLSLEDPVSIRHKVSTLKHSIRHQQAQLQNLETILYQTPRPLSFTAMSFSPRPSTPNGHSYRNHSNGNDVTDVSMAMASPPPSSYNHAAMKALKAQRRTSFEVLQDLAGPESQLPLPKKDGSISISPRRAEDEIKEGVPTDFSGDSSGNGQGSRRNSSPTRTLSRIPVASVGHARTLAEDGSAPRPSLTTNRDEMSALSGSINGETSIPPSPLLLGSSLSSSSSGSRRFSSGFGGGNTTKVLADLQAGVINARNALENTKSQLRLSQRAVAQLTRQTEDLKDGRERLRLENEGLNNVIARKERLLQEVLERARKAEAEAAALKTQLKTDTQSNKKIIREMEAQVAQSTAVSQKSEREYITLRDTIRQLSEGWKTDMEKLKAEMRKREEKWRGEAVEVGIKYKKLLEEVEKERAEKESLSEIRREMERVQKEWETRFLARLEELGAGIGRSERETEVAGKIAREVADELSRLRSLIRAVSTKGGSASQ